MQSKKIVFICERSPVMLREGERPYASFSHNTHMFLLAHEAVNLGWEVYFKKIIDDECYSLEKVYPTISLRPSVSFSDPNFQPDILVCVNMPMYITWHKEIKPAAIGVYILNAHFWLEAPEINQTELVDAWRFGFAHHIDFILTQNPRMQELAFCLFSLISGWQHRDRIICAPNTFTLENVNWENSLYNRQDVRKKMRLDDNDIAIINSGGPWLWTDIETFLIAFAEVVNEGAKRLKFFQMGIRQPNNNSQIEAEVMIRRFMLENYNLIETEQLHIFDNWAEASHYLPEFNYGADIGLNVSKDSSENYTSHRVRFIDYTKAGLPVLATTGNYYATYEAKNAVLTVEPSDVASYKAALWKIERGEINLPAMHSAMEKFRNSISSEKIMPDVLKQIVKIGRLEFSKRKEMYSQMREIYSTMTQIGWKEPTID